MTSDIEIRDYSPKCRTDDFVEAQREKLQFILEVQAACAGCPVLDGGDLFDKRYRSHPSYAPLQDAIEFLPSPFVTVPGNHDLPGHAIENYSRSAMAILDRVGRIKVANPDTPITIDPTRSGDGIMVYGFPYRLPQTSPDFDPLSGFFHVALVHAMVYKGKPPFPGCEGHEARDLLRLLPEFDLIVCGHNHQSFVEKSKDGRLLVNPGSLMRADANQVDYRPRIFAWFAKEREIIPIEIPIREGVVSRAHLEKQEERNERLEAFVSRISADVDEESVSFREVLSGIISANRITGQVREKVWQYLAETE